MRRPCPRAWLALAAAGRGDGDFPIARCHRRKGGWASAYALSSPGLTGRSSTHLRFDKHIAFGVYWIPAFAGMRGNDSNLLSDLGEIRHGQRGPIMTIELTMLALAAALGLVQIVLSAQSKNLQTGYRWAAGPRDEPRPPLIGDCRPAGAGAVEFPGDLPALRRRRADRPCGGAARLDDIVGRATLFLGPCPLRAALRFRGPLGPLARLERGDVRHHPHSAVAGVLKISPRSWRSRRR